MTLAFLFTNIYIYIIFIEKIMIKRISAIIVDPEKEKHDYDKVKSEVYFDGETGFDLFVLDGTENIEKVLSDNRVIDVIITISDTENFVYKTLCEQNFQIRKKWLHLDKFNAKGIANAIINVFIGNLDRVNPDGLKLFSFFTCTFNTPKEYIYRLYSSMLRQTYKEWNWYILDDSTNDCVVETIKGLNDSRITVIRNESNHGEIGFNKNVISMACDGDYLVEVDHDDELTDDCLFWLKNAFDIYPNTDFVYSDALEMSNGVPILYGENWGWGEGLEREDIINGVTTKISASPLVNPYSIRTIYAQPNHVRCWKKEFYHRIGGHNKNLGVMDDMELIIRTFLNGQMTKVNKVLYIQHEGDSPRGEESGETTQSKRFNEIQRVCYLLYRKYDKAIHDRILELGFSDYAWDEKEGSSVLWKEHTPGQEIMCNVIEINYN